jgi:hypothetical protein
MTKEHEKQLCSHDDLIEQANNENAISSIGQVKIENFMLKSHVEMLNIVKTLYLKNMIRCLIVMINYLMIISW